MVFSSLFKVIKKFSEKYISLITFIVFIISWQVIVQALAVEEYILPLPSQIIVSLKDNAGKLLLHTSYTISEAVVGMSLAIIIGIIIAILLFRNNVLERIFMPYINILQTIPAIVIAPLFAMWFGFGFFPKVLLVIIFCAFPIIVSTLSSFKEVDYEQVLYLKTLGISNIDLFKHLYIPVASPAIFASIKISATYALVNAIFAEYMGAKYGLGVYLNRASSSFSTTEVFAIIIVIIVVTLSLLKVVSVIEHRVIKWR